MAYELLIQNGDKVFQPVVVGDITWKTERKRGKVRGQHGTVGTAPGDGIGACGKSGDSCV